MAVGNDTAWQEARSVLGMGERAAAVLFGACLQLCRDGRARLGWLAALGATARVTSETDDDKASWTALEQDNAAWMSKSGCDQEMAGQ